MIKLPAVRVHHRVSVALAAGLLAAGGCKITESGTRFAYAVVEGTVRDAAGAPVAGAAVRAHYTPAAATCDPATGETTSAISTDAGGRYAIDIGVLNSDAEQCLTLRVAPPAESGLSPQDTSGLVIRPSFQPDPPRVTVDVVLR